MRKIIHLLLCLVVGMGIVSAQTKSVRGTVISAEDNEPIIGASVLIKGTGIGTITNIDGEFTLEAPETAETLVVSYLGMTAQEIAIGNNQSGFRIVLKSNLLLDEVVVTAMGVSREKKSLGYAVQEVSGDALSETKETNFVSSLSGKIAGVNITGSSGAMGGSSRITIRGVNSLNGENQPLFVIDGVPFDNSSQNTSNTQRGAGGYDYGNMAADLNSADIESVSVLKGPTAAALYGSRAANGVIVVTTKKGVKKGFGVSINSGVSFEQIAILPKYQNEYGGGGSGSFARQTIDGKEYNLVAYAVDASWGPKYNPNTMVLPWNAFDKWDVANYMVEKPWVAPKNDVRDFFNTGVAFTNNVSLSGADENYNFRISYTNMDMKGFIPGSEMRKNTLNINGLSKINKSLEAFATVTYYNNYAKGRPEVGYGDNSIMQKFNQWGQRQLDMKELKAYKNPDGSQRTWNRTSWSNPTPRYSNNPYWSLYEDYQDDTKNRVFGNVGFRVNIIEGLKFQAKFNGDYYQTRASERAAEGSTLESKYAETNIDRGEYNLEGTFSYNTSFNDHLITLDALAGANQMQMYYNELRATTMGGLLIPNLFSLTNAISGVALEPTKRKKMINSVFVNATVGYKSMLYGEITLRNDWSSTLPTGNNSYLYPSFSASYIFSESLKDLSWLTYGKLRAGVAQVGSDTDPYRLATYYTQGRILYGSWTNMTYDNTPVFSLPTRLNNANLKPEITSSWEIGTELRFLNNRLGFDATYYSSESKNQIIPVSVSNTSGYATRVINAGMITNQGIELTLSTTPVKTSDLTLDVDFNFAKNTNKVKKLTEGTTNIVLGTAPFNATVNASEGEPYGTIRATDYVYDKDGNRVVGEDGQYLASAVKVVGNVMPDWTGSINTRLKYKNFDLGALLDIRQGGSFFSTTNMFGSYSGILAHTAANGVRENGLVLDAVVMAYDANGRPMYEADGVTAISAGKNETKVGGQDYFESFYAGPQKRNILDASYVKLREITIGYTLPKRYSGPFQSLRVAAFGRNLYTWSDAKHIMDPENTTGSGNVQGLEGGSLPSVRSFGFNLSVNL